MAGLFRMSTQLLRLTVGNLLDSTSITKCGCVARQIVARRNAGSSTELFHRPTNAERRLLKWTNMYKSYAEIPEFVSINKVTKAKDLMRIRVAITMMLTTWMGGAVMIYTGRKARNSGDSITKRMSKHIDELAVQGRQEREIAAANGE